MWLLPERGLLRDRRVWFAHATGAGLLLGDELLTDEQAAARVWLIRKRTEHEAAAHFARLAADLRASGAPEAIVALSERASEDELRHAVHCRAVVLDLAPGLAPLAPDRTTVIAPAPDERARTLADRALYAAVAIGCITETLSTALLIELRRRTSHPRVRLAFDSILEDEIDHARLGWATLAWRAERGDVRWLAAHVPAMINAALDSGEPRSDRRLEHLGVLDAETVRAICEASVASTIVPGFAHFGIRVA